MLLVKSLEVDGLIFLLRCVELNGVLDEAELQVSVLPGTLKQHLQGEDDVLGLALVKYRQEDLERLVIKVG